MTPDEKARAEALGVMRGAREQVGLTVQEQARYVEGFVAGSAWQRSQPVEITEEMVEAAAWSLYASECRRQGIEPVKTQHEPGWSKVAWMKVARAALSAALGGEER